MSDGKSDRLLVALNLVADVLDVAAEAFGGLAAGAHEGHESQDQEEKQETFQRCFHRWAWFQLVARLRGIFCSVPKDAFAWSARCAKIRDGPDRRHGV